MTSHSIKKSLKSWDTYHTKGIRKKYLFRYGASWKVESFLETQSLYLSKMSSFDDKLEGISTYNITELRMAYETCFIDEEHEINPKLIDEWRHLRDRSFDNMLRIKSEMDRTQNAHFVSCWFNSDRESDGMWRLYNSDSNGFALRISRKQLQESVKKSVEENLINHRQAVIAGRVVYQDFPKVIEKEKDSQVKYLAFRKDNSFSHEREYRIVLIDLNPEATDMNNQTFRLIDFHKLDITIIANPSMTDIEYKEKKEQYEAYGDNIRVIKSELEPFYQFAKKLDGHKK